MDAPAPAVIRPVWLMLLMVTPRDHNIDWNFMHQACSLTRHAFFVPLHFRLLCIPHKNKLPLASYLLQGAVQLLQQFFGTDNDNNTTTDNQPAQLTPTTNTTAAPSSQQQQQQQQHSGAPSNTTTTTASSSSSSLNIQVYMQTDPHRIFRHLVEDLGMTLSSIPRFLGGQWEYSQFYAWCQDRMHWEHHQFAARLLDDKEESAEQQQPTVATTTTTTTRPLVNAEPGFQSPFLATTATATTTTAIAKTETRKRKRPVATTARDALSVHDSRAAFPATAIAAFGGNDLAAAATTTRTTNPPQHQQQAQAPQRTTPDLQMAWNDMDPQNKVLLGTNKGGASWKPTSTTNQKQPQRTTTKQKRQKPTPKRKEPPGSTTTIKTTTTMVEASIRNSLCQDDRLAKRRLADLFHSRRKRERKRQYVQALQQECTNLQHEQVQLQQRHGELQTWWNQARQVLFLHGVTEIGPCPIPITTTNTAPTTTEPMTTTTTTTRNGN